MGDKTKIEWTDASWNPIRARLRADPTKVGWHCEHASPGCEHCYSETLNRDRLGTRLPYKPGHRKDVEVYVDEKTLTQPLRWKRPRMIFVCSMTDLFGEFVTEEMIDRVFAVMALCPHHTFQILTKRSARMREYFSKVRDEGGICDSMSIVWERAMDIATDRGLLECYQPQIRTLPNVWLGVSVEDQQRADERIPDLLATPAAVRWLSCEPLLGEIDLNWAGSDSLSNPSWVEQIDWIVAGGESGVGARPMHPDWARSLRDQCDAVDVPFFFKQWGEWGPDVRPESADEPPYRDPVMDGAGPCRVLVDGTWREYPNGYAVPLSLCSGHGEFVYRLNKKRNGRLLDGVLHDAMPDAAHG